MKEVILEDIVEIFEEVVDLSDIQPSERMVLGEDIPVDSKEMLRILSRIEVYYRFKFEAKEVMAFKTLGDVCESVRRRGRKKQSSKTWFSRFK